MGLVLSICELLIYRKCDCLAVVDDMALYPPVPYYTVIEANNKLSLKYGYILHTSLLPSSMSVKFLSLDSNNKLCLVHFKSSSSKRVIIYSHGNAADIGCCIEYIELLGSSLDCDIIFYDYEGYGYSMGDASCRNLPRDLRAIYNYTCTLFSPDKIYLMGESIGSVPTCAVAAELFLEKNNHHTVGKEVEQPIAGVIIHAGLYSGQSYPCGCLIHCCDPLNNAKNVADIQCPIFHIHGKKDIVVPFKWGEKLYNASRSEFKPWWVSDSGHGDIFPNHPEEYIGKMNGFFHFCENKLIMKSLSSSDTITSIYTESESSSIVDSTSTEYERRKAGGEKGEGENSQIS